MAAELHDVQEWIDENEKYFQPPTCVKLMYKDGQLKTFFVGGPNQRKDFHMEAGEEFFYMLKGDMKLVVYEKGKFRDIIIKEGEVFLLPSCIPHSPQRQADTIGLVIERERTANEKDCLRYYVEGSDEILYEKWFYCQSLEELGPLIKGYFASEQHKTGKPIPGTLLEDKPLNQDHRRSLGNAFNLRSWIEKHQVEIAKNKKLLFSGNYSSRIWVLGEGIHEQDPDCPETFFMQLKGRSEIEKDGRRIEFKENQTFLVNSSQKYKLRNTESAVVLTVVMNPVG